MNGDIGERMKTGLHHSVALHVEELVLMGFSPAERYQIGEAIERELTKLFIERGAPHAITRGGEIARLDGGAFEVRANSSAEMIGAQVANAIYGGLKVGNSMMGDNL